MTRYLMARLLQALISIVLLASVVFLLVRLTGDPAQILTPEFAPIEVENRIRTQLGLDRPLYEQYLGYLLDLATFDLGLSFSGRPVADILLEALPATASLAAVALSFAFVVAIPLAMFSAARRGTWVDTIARAVALAGQSVPSFWLAIMLIILLGVTIPLLPFAGRTGPASYVLPAITLGLAPIAGIVRLLRSSMIETQGAEYVTMARAKGLPERVIVARHEFRNAIIPVLTFAGLLIGAFMNGSVVVESIFAWPGIGSITLNAVTYRDFPVVQGVVLMTAIFLIAANLVVDVLYAVFDPRIRYGASQT